jgi:hypothetical protein
VGGGRSSSGSKTDRRVDVVDCDLTHALLLIGGDPERVSPITRLRYLEDWMGRNHRGSGTPIMRSSAEVGRGAIPGVPILALRDAWAGAVLVIMGTVYTRH